MFARRPFRRLVYPIPEHAGLGVHATIDMQGSVRFGPDVEWISCESEEGMSNEHTRLPVFDYNVDPTRSQAFYSEASVNICRVFRLMTVK